MADQERQRPNQKFEGIIVYITAMIDFIIAYWKITINWNYSLDYVATQWGRRFRPWWGVAVTDRQLHWHQMISQDRNAMEQIITAVSD